MTAEGCEKVTFWVCDKGQEELKNGAEQRKGKSLAEEHYPHPFKRTFNYLEGDKWG